MCQESVSSSFAPRVSLDNHVVSALSVAADLIEASWKHNTSWVVE
jgi:hypothetical protein